MKIPDIQNSIQKSNLYVVVNGVGKVSLFSNFIDDIVSTTNGLISVSSPYPELFREHPKIHSSIDINNIVPDLYKKYYNNIIYNEPYFSNYIKGDEHILVSWRKLLGIDYENFEDYTDIYTDSLAKNYHQHVMENIKKQYIIVQFKGGNSPYSESKRLDNMVLRNYNYELELITKIHDTFKDFFIMIIKTSQDEYHPAVNNLDRICTVEDENILIIQELVNNCTTFVSIDSCVPHLACNRRYPKKGIVMWSNITHPHQIGHDLHINLQSESINELTINHEDVINHLKNTLEYI